MSPRFHVIKNNFIKYPGTYGIYIATSGNTATNQGSIINNMIGGDFDATTGYGIYLTTGSYWNIYHNSVNLNSAGTAATNAALYVTTGTNLNVRNNIFAVTNAASLGMALYTTGTTGFTTLNNNVYYRPDTASGIIYIGSALYPFNFKGNLGYNANSIFTAPGYATDTVLDVSNGCNNGAAVGVSTDIYGNTRNAIPDIGCVEVAGISDDLGLDAIVSPAFPMSSGTQDVVARLRNYGTNSIISANIYYKLNSATPVSQVWSGSLSPCDTVSAIFTGTNQVTLPVGIASFKVYTSAPNSVSDPNKANDTIDMKTGSPLNGLYTIGGSAPDFATIKEAVSVVNSVGVSGPVTFNIRTGTYAGNVLLSNIPGASATNRITFKSQANHRDSVLITYNATSAIDNYVVKMFNASYVTFKLLTINALNSVNARAVEFGNSSSYDSIYNCKINSMPSTSTAATLAGIYGDNITGGNNVISYNTISNGTYGIFFSGTSTAVLTGANNTFDGNTISGASYYSA